MKKLISLSGVLIGLFLMMSDVSFAQGISSSFCKTPLSMQFFNQVGDCEVNVCVQGFWDCPGTSKPPVFTRDCSDCKLFKKGQNAALNVCIDNCAKPEGCVWKYYFSFNVNGVLCEYYWDPNSSEPYHEFLNVPCGDHNFTVSFLRSKVQGGGYVYNIVAIKKP